jgi:hypothetical protein
MSVRLLATCLLLLLAAPSWAQKKVKQKNVPIDLLVVFRDTYPAATELQWKKHDTGYLVFFEHLGKRKQVVFGADMNWTYRESELSEVELPLPALVYLKEQKMNCRILDIRAKETRETAVLETLLQCPDDKKPRLLSFDRNGRLKTD